MQDPPEISDEHESLFYDEPEPVFPGHSHETNSVPKKISMFSDSDEPEPVFPGHSHETNSVPKKISMLSDSTASTSFETDVHMQWTPRKNTVYLFSDDEDRLIKCTVDLNRTYEKLFKKPAPFVTFVMVGFQSTGKTTLVDRFLGHALSTIGDGTATRCPLDITVLHDDSADAEPSCDLEGIELEDPGKNLSVKDVFKRIDNHSKRLELQQKVSKEPLKLVFRSSKVQNMRLVDIPGLKDNQDSKNDDREAIASILRHEMDKPNTKLCVMLQSGLEFATQPIIRRCDEIFGKRSEWVGRAVFVMTKGDRLMDEKDSHGRVNRYFRPFHENGIYPHLISNPTLDESGLNHQEIYEERQRLLMTANESEENLFAEWKNRMNQKVNFHGEQGWLDEEITQRLGFDSVQQLMRTVLLEGTRECLPEVRRELCHQQDVLQQERDNLEYRQKLGDVETLKPIVMKTLREIEDLVLRFFTNRAYAMTSGNHVQNLLDEVKSEKSSDWARKLLNGTREDRWRKRVEQLIASPQCPEFLQANALLVGGAQIRRVIDLFRYLLEQSFIDSNRDNKHRIINAVGFQSNGVMTPDWGQAIQQVIESHVKETVHPGINYGVKHAGEVCRRLIHQSFNSVMHDMSSDCPLLPNSVQSFILRKFDCMLWEHMKTTADRIGMAVEPMVRKHFEHSAGGLFAHPCLQYSIIDPSIFELDLGRSSGVQDKEGAHLHGAKQRGTVEKSATSRSEFLQGSKAEWVSESDANEILEKACAYHDRFTDLLLTTVRFQMSYHLCEGVKKMIHESFDKFLLETNWEKLVQKDPKLQEAIEQTDEKLLQINDSIEKLDELLKRIG